MAESIPVPVPPSAQEVPRASTDTEAALGAASLYENSTSGTRTKRMPERGLMGSGVNVRFWRRHEQGLRRTHPLSVFRRWSQSTTRASDGAGTRRKRRTGADRATQANDNGCGMAHAPHPAHCEPSLPLTGQCLTEHDLVIACFIVVADPRFLVVSTCAVERPRALKARQPRRFHQQQARGAPSVLAQRSAVRSHRVLALWRSGRTAIRYRFHTCSVNGSGA